MGCDSKTTEPDAAPPVLAIAFPNNGDYDRDSDGLVDFEITWSDDSQIDSSSFKVRPLGGVNGALDGSPNVLPGWRTASKSQNGIVFEESLDNLLHGGSNQVELSVADMRGNIVVDTIQVDLPHGALLNSIPTGVAPTGSSHARGVVVCPDDRRVYATVGRNIVVIDADSLKLIGSFPNPDVMDQLNLPLCVPNDDVLYVTYAVSRFDRSDLRWLSEVRPAFGSFGITQSSADANELYVGELGGYIGIIDRAQASRAGSIDLASNPDEPDERFYDLVMLPNRNKLYATRLFAGGIIAVDPVAGNLLSTLDLEPNNVSLGRSDAIELSPDGRWLYVALLDAIPPGLVEIDVDSDAARRRIGFANDIPQELAVSPSGRRIFVTTQDRNSTPSVNVLVDAHSFQVIQQFARPRAPGMLRIDAGVAFHPNGKFIFVGRDVFIDVYLNRE
jgi:DNA-binding beta-propeller fold protein YncE